MTDYELVYIFTENLNSLQSAFMNYVGVLFAFLIAAYLVAAKLESSMVLIVVGLFTLIAFQQVAPVFGYGSTVGELGSQIAARAIEDPSSLSWHGTAKPWGATALFITEFSETVVLVLSYIAGLVFFFHQRRVGRAQ